MAYTDGPLTAKTADAFTEDDGLDVAILDSKGRIIGGAFYQVGPEDFRPAEDNARLWASAPDLLRQRDELAAALRDITMTSVGQTPPSALIAGIMEIARAALAQLEPKQEIGE